MDPQKGKCKRDPRPTQGTALLLRTITISITMLLNSLFYPWKKIIQTLDVVNQKKVIKKIQERGCGRYSHFDQ